MDNVNVEEVDLQVLLGQLLPGFACALAEKQHTDSCTYTDGDPEPESHKEEALAEDVFKHVVAALNDAQSSVQEEDHVCDDDFVTEYDTRTLAEESMRKRHVWRSRSEPDQVNHRKYRLNWWTNRLNLKDRHEASERFLRSHDGNKAKASIMNMTPDQYALRYNGNIL
jgi:hypothetical protein